MKKIPYVCYNEEKHGSFDEPVKMSNKSYIIWRHGFRCTKEFKYPAKILIKISGKNIWYLGTLLLMRDHNDFVPEFWDKDIKHRPSNWKGAESNAKSVFFITDLKQYEPETRIRDQQPPQGVYYIELAL